jgi:site-specific DNA-cytosine methylase
LSDILETGDVPRRFYLSAKACAGILRRAEKRGKVLPAALEAAITAVDGTATIPIAFNARMDPIFGSVPGALDRDGQTQAVAFHENQRAEVTTSETVGALKSGGEKPGQGYPAVSAGMSVRRLTPRECERLMGLPDDYTLIPYRGKPAKDGPRYKALGNSMAVPVVRWIGERMQMVEELL